MEDKLEELTEIINNIKKLDVVKNTKLTEEALTIIDDIAELVL